MKFWFFIAQFCKRCIPKPFLFFFFINIFFRSNSFWTHHIFVNFSAPWNYHWVGEKWQYVITVKIPLIISTSKTFIINLNQNVPFEFLKSSSWVDPLVINNSFSQKWYFLTFCWAFFWFITEWLEWFWYFSTSDWLYAMETL